jgi:hypothetical protein
MKTNLEAAVSPETAVRPIASWRHLAGFFLIMAGFVAWGFHSQQAGIGQASQAATGQLAGHSAWLQFYLTSILGDCAIFYYCWAGVRHYGGNLSNADRRPLDILKKPLLGRGHRLAVLGFVGGLGLWCATAHGSKRGEIRFRSAA